LFRCSEYGQISFSAVFDINYCLSVPKILDLVKEFKRYKQKYALAPLFWTTRYILAARKSIIGVSVQQFGIISHCGHVFSPSVCLFVGYLIIIR